jgi:hypothetical protein
LTLPAVLVNDLLRGMAIRDLPLAGARRTVQPFVAQISPA